MYLTACRNWLKWRVAGNSTTKARLQNSRASKISIKKRVMKCRDGDVHIFVADPEHDTVLGGALVDHLQVDPLLGECGSGAFGNANLLAHTVADDHDQCDAAL